MSAVSDIRELVTAEATAARGALATLRDSAVTAALEYVADELRERRIDVLAANGRDVDAAIGRLDAGALDRLTLTPGASTSSSASSGSSPGSRHSSASSTPGNSRTVSPSAAGASR